MRNSVVISSPNFCFRVWRCSSRSSHPEGTRSQQCVATFEFQPNQPAEFLQNLQIATRLFRDQAFRDRGDAIRVQPSVGKAAEQLTRQTSGFLLIFILQAATCLTVSSERRSSGVDFAHDLGCRLDDKIDHLLLHFGHHLVSFLRNRILGFGDDTLGVLDGLLELLLADGVAGCARLFQ